MNSFQSTIILLILFTLRCLFPLLLTLAIGYLMNAQVTRWQAEEAAAIILPGQLAPSVGHISPDQPDCEGSIYS